MDYRDPLFSIILFLTLIAITILTINILAFFKEKNRQKYLDEFIKKFDFLENKDIESFFSDNISINALLLLAIAFEKEGNYEKSINIYLTLISQIEKNEKYSLLEKIAELYLKAGFLHKAKESLLEILRVKYDNINALNLLILVNEKLKDFDGIENILEILDELEQDTTKEKAYLEFQKNLFKQNKESIKNLYFKYPILRREIIQYFLKIDINQIIDKIENKDINKMIDIFWQYDKLNLELDDYKQLLAAKHILEYKKTSNILEIEILKYSPKDLADLEFEYLCTNCKQTFPIYESRCPSCKKLFTFQVETIITKKENNLIIEF